ncbi:hypothetical protein ACS0TY_036013 [Phlomoides rotata]
MSECFLGSLESLYLGSNNLSGALPVSIGKLSSLEILYIENNKLDGVVTESHFTNLTKLVSLHASKNHLTLNVSSDWSPSFQLKTLEIRSWNLGVGSKFPSWLEKQKHIETLDLHGTGITGSVPHSLWKIAYLDLSDNHLTGKIPEQVHCIYLYLSSNKFSGSVPRITGGMQDLDLSNNSFSGGNNNISGSIPNSIQFLTDLWSLNLGGNKISGQVPLSMRNCTKLVKIDLADNDLYGSIPTWMGTSLFQLQFLILRSNKLGNEIPSEICNLNSLQILDLADNQFSGRIPSSHKRNKNAV